MSIVRRYHSIFNAHPNCYNDRMIHIEPHPKLDAGCLVATFPQPVGGLSANPIVQDLLQAPPDASVPLQSSDEIRKAVRDLLRHGGFKPTGRNKPASEYLIRAVAQGLLSSINPVVDALNAASLHSGLPISVVDRAKLRGELRIAIAPEGTEYVFNPSGHALKLDGLLCLFDDEGPCANAVKDSQRTKTSDETRQTLSIVWGTSLLEGRTQATLKWYAELLGESDATTEVV